MPQETVPFFKVRKKDRDQILTNLRTYTAGDRSKVTTELAKTAIKAAIDRDSKIVGVPTVIALRDGYGVYIGLRDQTLPAFTTIAQLSSMI